MNRWYMKLVENNMAPVYEGDPAKAHELAREKTTWTPIYRKHVRTELFRRIKTCEFPGCQNEPSDMHELVNRGRTNPDTWQRLLTYQPELCSLLCKAHHEGAHNPKVRAILFRQNFKRYEQVKQAFERLKLALPSLDIRLPVFTPNFESIERIKEESMKVNLGGLNEDLLNVLLDAGICEETWEQVGRVPTGSLALDFATSGGWPRGRWSVIWGAESSGKSTTSLLAGVDATLDGGNAAYLDIEHTFDETWAKKLGFDITRLYVTRPSYTEEALNMLRRLIKLNIFDLIILDSIGGMASIREVEGDIGDTTVAINARYLKDFFARVTPELEATRTAVLFLNQLRFKIGGNDPDPETMPGGQALKHAASVIVKMQRAYDKHVLMKGDEVVGNIFRGKVTKNKLGPPKRKFEFCLRQDGYFGVDQIAEAGPLAVKLGVLQTKEGAVYEGRGNAFLNGKLIGNGVKQITDAFYNDHELFNEVEARIREALGSFVEPLAEEEEESGWLSKAPIGHSAELVALDEDP